MCSKSQSVQFLHFVLLISNIKSQYNMIGYILTHVITN